MRVRRTYDSAKVLEKGKTVSQILLSGASANITGSLVNRNYTMRICRKRTSWLHEVYSWRIENGLTILVITTGTPASPETRSSIQERWPQSAEVRNPVNTVMILVSWVLRKNWGTNTLLRPTEVWYILAPVEVSRYSYGTFSCLRSPSWTQENPG